MSDPGQSSLTVLVADFDLMSGIGDRHGIYRRLFHAAASVQFTYLRDVEQETYSRPNNVAAISCARGLSAFHEAASDEQHWVQAFRTAERIAAAVGPRSFDILEIPTHHPNYLLLPLALMRRGAKIGKVVVAQHEENSSAIEATWDRSPREQFVREKSAALQQLLYATADVRYGISRANLDEWKKTSPFANHYLNPPVLLDFTKPAGVAIGDSRPDLVCFTDMERRRGPGQFLEMVWKLPRTAYSRVSIVDAGTDPESAAQLREMARARDLDVSIDRAVTPGQVADMMTGRCVVFALPRSDTLNLTALESLKSGCPTFIADGSEVGRLLQDEWPGIPFDCFDLKNSQLNAERAKDVLDNYDTIRETILSGLASYAKSWPDVELTIIAVYRGDTKFDTAARQTLNEMYNRQRSLFGGSKRKRLKAAAKGIQARLSPRGIAQRMRDKGLSWIVASYHLKRLKSNVANNPTSSAAERRSTISILEKAVGGERFGRAWIWAMLSRLEMADGRDLVAAAYLLRTMRLVGSGTVEQLATVIGTLKKHGFDQESMLTELMYGRSTPDRRHANLLAWLDDHEERHTTNPATTFVRVDDRRGREEPRAAVVVSLYNAASKLTHFLDAIYRQTLFASGQAELILIDSGSPQDEYAPIAAHPGFSKYPSVYVRTEQRETIQQAWNRGVSLTRAPYLTMLGADETILPECLELLAAELDRRPDLDWIQSNWLVTETDARGEYDRDDTFSDRDGYQSELVRLDPAYLSWVGALYRRNIHDRFGYYDPTFRAQGDNEFKLRMLPYLNSDAYLRTLGVFWNFPELRVTQYPSSEIEGYRAWHVFRTSAGVEYAHRESTPQKIVECAGLALGYRRSHCHVRSTDLEYACELLRYAVRRDPHCFPAKLLRQMERSMQDFRVLDQASWSNSGSMLLSCGQIFSRLHRLNGELAKQFANRPRLSYFNDERCEHINWCWSYLS